MEIAIYTLRTVAFIITQPISLIVFGIFAFILYKQNLRTTVMQKMIIGESLDSPIELTISQIVLGIIAGALGSIILSYLGVIFDENSAIGIIFLVSLLLMFINPKFICFSYSGAVIGLISVVLNKIATMNKGVILELGDKSFNLSNIDFLKIDIVSLMTLIGVLHIVEGILVLVDGKRGAIPVFTSKDGNIIGGFALKRYWILPITLMVMSRTGTRFSSPTWWPLISTSVSKHIIRNAAFSMLPLFGGIGYNSITFTKSKNSKTVISGAMIFTYGLILTFVAQIGNINIWGKLFVIIFAPLVHEGMLRLSRYLEEKNKPKFFSANGSIMVLDVAPNTPAKEMGIESGDKIIEINNRKVESEQQLINIMTGTSNFFWLKIEKNSGELKEVNYNKMNESKKLGIVFIPMSVPEDSLVVKFDENNFSDVLDNIKNKKDK